ncbi:IQ motif and ubiquitin-like domain-containing protein isoform X2 [Hemitrygon akajei]|uniref:IQ motif and ubiquitin-like domain-containing protein isoform X2 n=1 Tax=Hemitrygon akajei TaxID=2704970 RepID=UPI003BF97A0B
MAENENHMLETQEQGDSLEKEDSTQATQEPSDDPEVVENPSDQCTNTDEVSQVCPSDKPADGMVDASTKIDNTAVLHSEEPESSDHVEDGTVEGVMTQEEITTDETVETKHVVTPDHAEDSKLDSEIINHGVGEGPTAEVIMDETVGKSPIATPEGNLADVTKTGLTAAEPLIIDCSKIHVGEAAIILDCFKCTTTESSTLNISGPSHEMPEGGPTVTDGSSRDMEGAASLDPTKFTASIAPDQSNEQSEAIEPSLTCEELKKKLEAQIQAIEEVHGKIEPAVSESPVSQTKATECLLLQTPETVADRDIKKRSTLKSYPAPPKTPSPDFASSTATVKVALLPSDDVMTVALPICFTIGKLKSRFGRQLKLPTQVLQVTCDGRTVKDSETLVDLGVRPHGAIQLELISTDPENCPIKQIRTQQEATTSDVITVKVQKDNETSCSVVVEIERLPYHKPYLGGYRHKLTGTEFHHAGTQTPSKRNYICVERFSRETQTVSERNQYQQTTNNTSTQMTKIGCYVSNITDKLLTPRPYFTAEEYHACRLNAVIVIQTYFRQWSAKNYVHQLRMQRDRRLQWEQEQEVKFKKERTDYIKKQYERRMNPKTKEDFDLLFHALEEWKQDELSTINQNLTGPERKAALCTLLEQEAKLIASIGRHRVDAAKETGPKLIQNLLNKCADPIRWKAFDGRITEMDTQFTIRARELHDIYNSINMKYLTTDERLDALLTLKHTVKEHDCKLTQEIVDLIDREADLIMRQVKETYLDGLRQRISTLFLQYIKTPMFNPEVARFLKVPQDPMELRKNIYFCSGCGSYLPSTEFPLSLTSQNLHMCRQCIKQNNEACHREESSQYKMIMKQLRKTEADFGDGAQIAFLLQEQDMKYLIDSIWGTQSALSANANLKDLIMIRWDKMSEWSPWNCILLTEEEAAAHLKLGDIEKDYEAMFIRKIKHRHTLGKSYFSRIPEIMNYARTCLMKDSTSTNDLVITNLFHTK